MLLEMVCRGIDRLVEVEEYLAVAGRWYTTPQGHELPRPAVADARHLSGQVVSWLAMAGFTATDRARLNIPIAYDDALEVFRARRSSLDARDTSPP
jgi:hypothetical protein